MGFELTALFIAVLIALLIVLVKFLLCNCLYTRDDDATPILPTRREAFWIEYDRLRMESMESTRNRQPPPDFDEALRNSRPVSYIDTVEEEPPPTYDDFLKSHTPSPTEPSPLQENNHASHYSQSPFEDDFIVPPSPPHEDFSVNILQNLGTHSEA